jgi:protein gp37
MKIKVKRSCALLNEVYLGTSISQMHFYMRIYHLGKVAFTQKNLSYMPICNHHMVRETPAKQEMSD